VPTKAEVDAGSAMAMAEFILHMVVLFHVFSDGCSRQYAGRKNYLKVAEIFSEMKLIMLQHTAQAHCFKGIWDGLGKDAKQGARDAVRRGAGKVTISTTKPWYDFLIDKFKTPATAEGGAQRDKVFGANNYFWVYDDDAVWDGKEFDANKLPQSKSYHDVKGRIMRWGGHPSEGTWPLHRRWLWCFCRGCRAANAADVAAITNPGSAPPSASTTCVAENWTGKFEVVNCNYIKGGSIAATKKASVAQFMSEISAGAILVVAAAACDGECI
jgi:hypothetical protein